MPIIFVQEDTARTCANGAYCSGLNADVGLMEITAVEGGSAGSVEDGSGNFTNSDATIYRVGYIDIPIPSGMVGEVGASGTWTVRLNHTTNNANIDIEEIHICLIAASGCANRETIGSLTAIARASNESQPMSFSVTQGSDTSTINSGDRVMIVIGYQNNGAHGNNAVGLTPSVNIDCPWTVPVAEPGDDEIAMAAQTRGQPQPVIEPDEVVGY